VHGPYLLTDSLVPSTKPKKKSNIVGIKNIKTPIINLLPKVVIVVTFALSSPLKAALPKSIVPKTIIIIGTNILIIYMIYQLLEMLLK